MRWIIGCCICVLFSAKVFGSAVNTFEAGAQNMLNNRVDDALAYFSQAVDKAKQENNLELTTRSRFMKMTIFIMRGERDLAKYELDQIEIEEPEFCEAFCEMFGPHRRAKLKLQFGGTMLTSQEHTERAKAAAIEMSKDAALVTFSWGTGDLKSACWHAAGVTYHSGVAIYHGVCASIEKKKENSETSNSTQENVQGNNEYNARSVGGTWEGARDQYESRTSEERGTWRGARDQ